MRYARLHFHAIYSKAKKVGGFCPYYVRVYSKCMDVCTYVMKTSSPEIDTYNYLVYIQRKGKPKPMR